MMALEFVLVLCLRHTHMHESERGGEGGDNLVNVYLPVENLGFKLVFGPTQEDRQM